MGMQLNIKSDDAYALATELSEITGESLTAAVTTALRERLDRERKAKGREAKLRKVRGILADMHADLGESRSGSNHDWLYDDETGLPA